MGNLSLNNVKNRYDEEFLNEETLRKQTFVSKDSDKYEGDLLNGKKHGKGTCWLNGDKYVGDWTDGFRNGKGVLFQFNGDVYNGNWTNDNQTGNGTLTYANNDKYEGEFLNGKKNGRGTFTWNNGDQYDGYWIENNMTVNGTYTYSNGDKYYEENEKNDQVCLNEKKAGKGTYFFDGGAKIIVNWVLDYQTGDKVYSFLIGDGKLLDQKLNENEALDFSNVAFSNFEEHKISTRI